MPRCVVYSLTPHTEAEQKEKGDQSGLHVIVMYATYTHTQHNNTQRTHEHCRIHSADLSDPLSDEIDSICKRRGTSSDSTNVADNVVNQLLSKLDGNDPLNNILVIGMTNRIDILDPAILRPGRFGLHIEIGLPDEKGRLDILRIHTKYVLTLTHTRTQATLRTDR